MGTKNHFSAPGILSLCEGIKKLINLKSIFLDLSIIKLVKSQIEILFNPIQGLINLKKLKVLFDLEIIENESCNNNCF